MDVVCLFIKRKNCESEPPELLTAWDEYTIDENQEGWAEACRRALAEVADDVDAHRFVKLRVREADLEKAFEVPVIEAKV